VNEEPTLTRRDDPLRVWKVAALVGAGVIVAAVPLHVLREAARRAAQPAAQTTASFVGRERCRSCHEAADRAFEGSDHDLAMAEATEQTVLGDFDDARFVSRGKQSRFYRRDGRFFVHTEDVGGEPAEFEIAYTFGHEPLQQYLIRFPGGRLQALSIAWDRERERWFHLYPDQDIPPEDWLHWTRNAQNWNGMCAECHSTNLKKSYDPETDSYATSWSEIDVSCEACHGPGSRHVAWAELPAMARPELPDAGLVLPTSGISSRELVELCAPCHSRRTELGDYDHTRLPLLDNHLPALLREGLYHADGQILDEVYVWGSFVQSKMYANEVRCSDCHDSHSLKLHHEGNALCLQCHRADAYDTKEHHFHEKLHEGRPSEGALCVKCHMMERPYMVIDWRADHSLRVPRPDLSLELGAPNACSQAGCHADRPVSWSADAYKRWYGLARKPHYGTLLAAGRRRDESARGDLIALAENALYPTIVRATALSLLDGYPGEDTTAALERALLDEEPLIRHTAVASLDVAEPEALARRVGPLLFDPARAVRLQAVSMLAGPPSERLKPYQKQVFTAALDDYRAAMKYSLDFAFAGFNLGNLAARLGDSAAAERFYRKAIAVDDLFMPAKMNLAVLLDAGGRTREAAEVLRGVVEAYPDDPDAAYSLALTLAQLQRYAEAETYLRRAAQARPTDTRILYNHGLLLQHLGRDADAEVVLKRALDLEPESFDLLYALADFYVKRERVSEVATLAERLVAVHPSQKLGHDLREWVRRHEERAAQPSRIR
jgi:tetratricopeptide (TPR) repeat protein